MLLENMNGFCHTAMLDQAPADTIPSVRIQCGTKSGWRKAAHPTRHSEKLSLTNDFFTISHTISISGTIEKHFMCISFQIMKFTRHDKHMLCTCNTVELSSYALVFFLHRSTAELESYHNHMLMYSSKRYAYTPPVYRARSILAALDFNENVNREPIMNRDGTIRYVHSYMHAQYMYLYWYIGVFYICIFIQL